MEGHALWKDMSYGLMGGHVLWSYRTFLREDMFYGRICLAGDIMGGHVLGTICLCVGYVLTWAYRTYF